MHSEVFPRNQACALSSIAVRGAPPSPTRGLWQCPHWFVHPQEGVGSERSPHTQTHSLLCLFHRPLWPGRFPPIPPWSWGPFSGCHISHHGANLGAKAHSIDVRAAGRPLCLRVSEKEIPVLQTRHGLSPGLDLALRHGPDLSLARPSALCKTHAAPLSTATPAGFCTSRALG